MIILILAAYFATLIVFPKRYDKEIAAASSTYNIDENIIRAVIWTESKWREDNISAKGASGLMQLMPTARSEQSLYSGIAADGSPYSEIMLGTGYLARMIALTPTLDDALMAYNAGIGNWSRWEQPFKESSDYVNRVHFAKNIYSLIRS